MISVLIATKNRSMNIISCIQSILRNGHSNFEIIIIDQSTDGQTRRLVKSLHNEKIIYMPYLSGGKSAAINAGIRHSRGNILAFTDDDCIVTNAWLQTLEETISTHADVSMVTGKTLPYQPEKHLGQLCPCTFLNTHEKTITKLCIHYRHIGYGNNMGIKKQVFQQLGGFKEWLGPGSIGSSADDADLFFRLLILGKRIQFNPNMIAYHNRWPAPEEMKKLELSYICGETACYGFYYFQGYLFAKNVVTKNMIDSYFTIKFIFKNTILLRWTRKSASLVPGDLLEIFYRFRGLFIGLIFSVIYPIQKSV